MADQSGVAVVFAPPPRREWTPETLRNFRVREVSLSQVELAAKAGVHQARISAWETGKTAPSGVHKRLLDYVADGLINQPR